MSELNIYVSAQEQNPILWDPFSNAKKSHSQTKTPLPTVTVNKRDLWNDYGQQEKSLKVFALHEISPQELTLEINQDWRNVSAQIMFQRRRRSTTQDFTPGDLSPRVYAQIQPRS